MMSIVKRIREMTPAQRAALRALDREERSATELDDLEAEHLAAEEAYLRRKDQLLGHEVPARYEEIETARAELERRVAERARRFERLRMAVLAGHGVPPGDASSEQLTLLPQQG
jgi:hypothetical protein